MQEINLYDLIRHYIKYWYFIVGATVIGLFGGLIYSQYIQKPLYKSNATLLVVNNNPTTSKSDTTLINNYQQLIKSRRVIEPVISKLNINESFQSVVGAIETSSDKDTEVIKLAYSSGSAERSKELLDGTIESFKDQVKELYEKENIQVVDSASISFEPFNVNKRLQLALAGAVGLLASIIILFFVYDFKINNKNKPKNKPTSKPNKSKPSILSRYIKKSAAIRKYLTEKHQVKSAERKAKRELEKQKREEERKAKDKNKVQEQKAKARKRAAQKAAATKKAKAEMAEQAKRDEAERILRLEEEKIKQASLEKQRLIAEAEAKKVHELKEIEAKKAQAIKEARAIEKAKQRQAKKEERIAKAKATFEEIKRRTAEERIRIAEERKQAKIQRAKQSKIEARKRAAQKAAATRKAKAEKAKKEKLAREAEIKKVLQKGRQTRAKQAAEFMAKAEASSESAKLKADKAFKDAVNMVSKVAQNTQTFGKTFMASLPKEPNKKSKEKK